MKHISSALLVAVVALSVSACSPPPPPETAKDKDAIAFYSTQDTVKAQLRDPDSAEFSDQYRVGHNADGGANRVCGKVNAKNGFGGYTGEQYYMVNGDGQVTISPDPDTWGACDDTPDEVAAARATPATALAATVPLTPSEQATLDAATKHAAEVMAHNASIDRVWVIPHMSLAERAVVWNGGTKAAKGKIEKKWLAEDPAHAADIKAYFILWSKK